MTALQFAAVCKDITFEKGVPPWEETVQEDIEGVDLPSEDGIPLETNWHRIEMNLLIDSVHYLWRDRNDYFAGGNMFIYFSSQQVKNRDYRGPDFFVVKETDMVRPRDSWVVWEEAGQYPNVIVELASPSTIMIDLGIKKNLYENVFATKEYFCYDPFENWLIGWRLVHGVYVELKPNSRGWLWSEELGVWLGIWEGEFQRVDRLWLRFYSENEQLILTHKEAEAQRAEAETKRAEAETKRAEAEAQRAEAAEAELNHLRALLAKQGIADEHKMTAKT